MADGIPCKHCGQQETTHDMLGNCEGRVARKKFLDESDDGRKKWPGRKTSLARCKGYVAENEELAEALKQEADDEKALREARHYGYYCDD